MSRKETWRKGIKITDMKEGDVIYVRKLTRRFGVFLECEFIKYEKGIVHAKVSAIPDPKWFDRDFPIGKVITARRKSCMLWGKDENAQRATCKWFGRDKKCHSQ